MSEPRIIEQLDPYEIEALIKARKEAEAAREAARLAALPVKEYDPMPGPEAIPNSWRLPVSSLTMCCFILPYILACTWGSC